MQDTDVKEHIIAVFTPLIMDKKTIIQDRKRSSTETKLSGWKPYQATSTDKRPAVTASRTLFNLVSCDSDFEKEFAFECDRLDDVEAFAKNAGPQKLTIDYLKPDKHRAMYVPDFFVKVTSGDVYLCELKGREDNLVALKAKAAIEWCKSASKGKVKWHYLYIPYHLFQQSTANSLEELARACEPSLQNLIKEGVSEQIYIDFDAVTETDLADPLFNKIMKISLVNHVPEDIHDSVRQALLILDHAEKTNMSDYAHAFQPLLYCLDDYAMRLLVSGLQNRIPTDIARRDAYFMPDLSSVFDRKRNVLEKFGRYLRDNLVFARPIMKLGTLLFCLEYAQKGGFGANGVWKDVEKAYSGSKMEELYNLLTDVNEFRNTRVAHVEVKLSDANEAWENMGKWVKCLSLINTCVDFSR
jgi:type III restriction enzyme